MKSICREAVAYPNMRVVIACRDFDLEHDQRLRRLKQPQGTLQVAIQRLPIEEVDAAVTAAGQNSASLSARQKKLLRTPLHLFLFLSTLGSGDPPNTFRTIGDLFDHYWEYKQRRVSERLGYPSAWTSLVDKLCEVMSRDGTMAGAAELERLALEWGLPMIDIGVLAERL